jgi:hypothetical protein
MPPPLIMTGRPHDSENRRHCSIQMPKDLFVAVAQLADQEGRNFSQQATVLIREAIKRRNGGKTR